MANICQKVTLIDGKNNISNQQLFDANKIVFPYLCINIVLIKQHAKAFNKKGECLSYISNVFPGPSKEKKENEGF